ncbi:MAG: preprotein translocase subunit YajC [Candidatus Cloacimonetes bacterium]|nr:preprotein translocase subunit YajC [Candidatus Cloacimonadota bacterium]
MEELATTAAQPQNPMGMLLPFIMMIGVVYLLIIRPQQKQRKEHQKMLDSLKINDKVVTSSGMIGKITNIKNEKNTIILRVDDNTNTKIEFQKSSVVSILDSKEEDGE